MFFTVKRKHGESTSANEVPTKKMDTNLAYSFDDDDDILDCTDSIILRPYQEKNIEDMWTLESQGVLQDRKLYGATYAVTRQAYCGILSVKVGGGKTCTTLKFIDKYNLTAHKRIVMGASFMHIDHLRMTHYRVNLVVVPSHLFHQWSLEIDKCNMHDGFLFYDNASYLNEFFIQIQAVRTRDDDFDNSDNTYLNVLCSDTFYEALSKSRIANTNNLVRDTRNNRTLPRFNKLCMLMRVFFDEADKNHIPIYADFVWLISATLPFKIKQCQTIGGTSYRRDTMLGNLKLTNQYFDVNDLCVCTPDEIVDSQSQILPIDSFRFVLRHSVQKKVLPKCDLENNGVDNWLDIRNELKTWYRAGAIRHNIQNVYEHAIRCTAYTDFCLAFNKLCPMSHDVFYELEQIFSGENKTLKTIFVVYYTNYDTSAYVDIARSIIEKIGVTPSFWTDRSGMSRYIQTAVDNQTAGKDNIIFMNGKLIQTGLNLNFATHAIVVGNMPMSIFTQILGRFQRPPRSSPLSVVRILTFATPLIKNMNNTNFKTEVALINNTQDQQNCWSFTREEALNDFLVALFQSAREETRERTFKTFKV